MNAARRPALLLAGLLLIAGCGEKPAEKKAAGPPPALITVTQAQALPLEIVEQTLGSLAAVMDPKIAAEVAGRVLRVAVRGGQPVRKGQLVAELDATDAGHQHQADQAEVARVTALLAQQERLVARQAELLARNFVSRHALDDASAQQEALKSQLALARARAALSASALGHTRVVAPFDGTIEVLIASTGDYLKLGDPVASFVSTAKLRAHLPFPEGVAERLKRGQAVRLSSPLAPGRIIDGVVEDFRPSLTETSRAVDVIARVDSADGLKNGGSVNATVIVGRKDGAVMVPEQSVVLRPAGKVVYAVIDGKAEQRPVDTGAKQNGMVEILKGVAAGETVALDGAGFLTHGAAVVVPAAQQPPAAEATKTAQAAK